MVAHLARRDGLILDQHIEDLLLIAEVMIQGGAFETQLFRDIVHRRAGIAARRKQLCRLIEQLTANQRLSRVAVGGERHMRTTRFQRPSARLANAT